MTAGRIDQRNVDFVSMKSLIRLLLLLLPLAAAAQSQLPPCPADEKAYRHNCFGSVAYANGDKYVGEFKEEVAPLV